MRQWVDASCCRRGAALFAAATAFMFGLVGIPALAVEVRHNGVAVFDSRGFEYEVIPGPARYPRLGTWAHTRDAGQMPDGGSMLLTDVASPGPAQGRIYQRLTRFTDQVNSDAVFAGGGLTSGTLRAEWMVRIPADSNINYNGTAQWINAVGGPAGGVCINGSGTVQALNATGTAWIPTGVPYLVNQWQKWSLNWTIGQATMMLTVGSNSALIPAKNSPGSVTQLRFTSGGGGATFYIDSAAPDETVPFGILDITWTLGTDHPSYRKGGAVGFVGGMVVSAGGAEYPWAESSDVYGYAPGTNTWTTLPDMPAGRAYFDGTTVGDALYVAGGRKDFATQTTTYRLRRINGTWTWSTLPSMHVHRGYFTMGAIGTRIMIAGGMQGSGQPPYSEDDTISSAEWFDTANTRAGWSVLPDLIGHSRAAGTAAGAGGRFHLFGGTCYQCPDGQNDSLRLAEALVYDPALNQWSNLPSPPYGMSNSAAVVYYDRYIIMVGGVAQLTDPQKAVWPPRAGYYSNVVLVYDTHEARYRAMPTLLPYGTGDIRAVLVGKTIYAVGGENIDPATSNTTKWLQIGQVQVRAPADLDADGDVDLTDFATFQTCFNGPNQAPARTGCVVADLDADSDVDLADFAAFARCYNGPNRPPACP